MARQSHGYDHIIDLPPVLLWSLSQETPFNSCCPCFFLCFVRPQVSAEDLDSQVNGRITYSILKGDRSNQFWIDPVTGLLKVNKQLDRELVRRRL